MSSEQGPRIARMGASAIECKTPSSSHRDHREHRERRVFPTVFGGIPNKPLLLSVDEQTRMNRSCDAWVWFLSVISVFSVAKSFFQDIGPRLNPCSPASRQEASS